MQLGPVLPWRDYGEDKRDLVVLDEPRGVGWIWDSMFLPFDVFGGEGS